jgi:CheY-like chemotaxis protein
MTSEHDAERVKSTREPGDRSNRRNGSPTVLIVDDETDVRSLLRLWFEHAGLRVMEAADGLQALAMVGQDIDLVVTDLMMPEMDGRTFIATLRRARSTRHLPIVVATAAPQAGIDATAVFTKPFVPSELVEVARSLLQDGDDDPTPARLPSPH